MNKVGIVIINYNGWKDTIECLNSIFDSDVSSHDDVKLFIIDNGSSNESIYEINNYLLTKESYQLVDEYDQVSINSKIILYNARSNSGFSGGNNIGINLSIKCNCDYILMLNNDTVVTKDFLRPMLSMFDKDDKLGMVGCKIYDYYDKNDYILGGYIDRKKCSGYHFYNTEKMHNKYVTFLSGCIWLIKLEAVCRCGYMDEKFFLYVEDVDYCFRMNNSGYKLGCTKEASIYHKESKSTVNKPIIGYYNTRNRLYLNKKINHNNRIFSCEFMIYFVVTRIVRIVTRKQSFSYVEKGFKDFFKKSFGIYNG